jgi:hypothetical protein
MVVRIDEDTKKRFLRTARMEGKSASEKIREMVEDYLSQNDMATVVDQLWERIGSRLRLEKVTDEDIDKAIRDFRHSR